MQKSKKFNSEMKSKKSITSRKFVGNGSCSKKSTILGANSSNKALRSQMHIQKSPPTHKRKTIASVSGIRTLATIWIVLGHFQDTAFRYHRDEQFLMVLNRGYIPVGMYIVLSGFITHYAYQNKQVSFKFSFFHIHLIELFF